jgi:UDP-GlcNAc:undecaprenyl-phosphate GlcNAc-1-phosphate transferase
MTAVTFVAFPVSALVIWTLLRTGLARRIVAAPRSDRWHGRTTPTLGGIGIFAGILAGVGAALAAGVMEPRADLLGILGGCTILFLVGLADDVLSLGALPKLLAQLAAAALLLATGLTVEIVGNNVLGAALAVLWLVGMTNAFNLLDNMDGLAATLAAIACFYFALDAFAVNESVAALVLSISIGLACVGFLPFNIRPHGPALIFMGDSGSQMLGFAVAALALFSTHQVAGATLATLALPILILAVPVFDTALVTVVRLLEGRPVYQGGRDHTSHRLVYQGLTEKRALVLLALLSAALGATALGYSVLDDARVTVLGVLLTFAALVQFASFIGQIDRHATSQSNGSWLTRTLVVHRRRLAEVLVDGALLGAAFLGAYLLVVRGEGTVDQRHLFMAAFPVVLFARYACFVVFGLYSGVWRYAGARDAVSVAVAVAFSGLLAFTFLQATGAIGDLPATIFVVDALLATVLIGASRFGERAIDGMLESLSSSGERRRTLILGAGRAGRSLLRELRETQGEQVVGFVDDDRALRRRRIQGAPVLGATADLEKILASVRPDAVLVTIPDAPRERLDSVVRACARAHVRCRFVRRETDLDPEVVLGGAIVK